MSPWLNCKVFRHDCSAWSPSWFLYPPGAFPQCARLYTLIIAHHKQWPAVLPEVVVVCARTLSIDTQTTTDYFSGHNETSSTVPSRDFWFLAWARILRMRKYILRWTGWYIHACSSMALSRLSRSNALELMRVGSRDFVLSYARECMYTVFTSLADDFVCVLSCWCLLLLQCSWIFRPQGGEEKGEWCNNPSWCTCVALGAHSLRECWPMSWAC